MTVKYEYIPDTVEEDGRTRDRMIQRRVPTSATYAERHPPGFDLRPPAYDVTGPDPRVPTLDQLRFAPPAPTFAGKARRLPREIAAGGSLWWRLKMEKLAMSRRVAPKKRRAA